MIRMIVAVLLAANLALLVWVLNEPEDAKNRPPQAGGDLKLLSEVKKNPAPASVPTEPEVAAARPAEAAQIPAAKPAQAENPASSASAPQPAVMHQAPEPPKTGGAVTQSISEPSRQVKTEVQLPTATPSAPAHPEAAQPVAVQTPEPAPKEPEPVAVKTESAKPSCYSFGPLEERLAAIGIMARLKEKTSDQDIRQEGTKLTEGFRVLIRTAKTEEESRALEQRVLAAGITDIWRISRGEDQNAISMGMFSQRANAAKRVYQAKGLGFEAIIEPKVADKERFWIEFVSDQETLSAADLGLKPGPGQSLKKRPCNGKDPRKP